MPRRTKNTAAAELEIKIENNVAGRIRLRRGLLGMSQSDLARALGITFQQVQKYERGSNRVSIGKMYRMAEILDVPLTFFFDGLDDVPGLAAPGGTFSSAGEETSPTLSRRDLDLLRAWRQAPPEVADAVASLLRAVSAGEAPPLAPETAPHTAPDTGADKPITPSVAAPAAPRQAAPAEGVPDLDGAPPSPQRRRRGAVWDPADMKRAAAPKSSKR